MEAYQERVVKERDELHTKLTALTAFLAGDSAKALSARDLSHLVHQRRAMLEYCDILDTRIHCFTSDIIPVPIIDVPDSQPVIPKWKDAK
jgi:hypothetical protein